MTQIPVKLENSDRHFFSTNDFSSDEITSAKSIKLNQMRLGKKILLIILPIVLGSLAFSNFLNYQNSQARTKASVQSQLENEVILFKETAKQLFQANLKTEPSIQLISQGFSKNQFNLKSHHLQIIDPQKKVALQTINEQKIIQVRPIIGGSELTEIAKLIQQQSNNFQVVEQLLKQKKIAREIIIQPQQSLVSFSYQNYFYTLAPLDKTNLVAVASFDLLELETSNQRLILNIIKNYLLLGIVITIFSIIAIYKILQPLRKLVKVSQQANLENLNLVVDRQGTLETQTLTYNFNKLIFKIIQLSQDQQTESERAKACQELILNINRKSNLKEITEIVVQQIYLFLQTERVVYCQVNNLQQGQIINEAINNNYISILEKIIKVEDYISSNKINIIQVFESIESGFLSKSQQQQLQTWQVQAMIIAPVLVNRQLEGFVMIHNCAEPRIWLPQEIDSIEQITYQMGLAFTRLQLVEQQKFIVEQEQQTQTKLKQKISNLIEEIKQLQTGDLTLRASFTTDEIGTIAEAYNLAIESWHQAIAGFKTIVAYVEENTVDNQQISQHLTTEIVRQGEQIAKTQQQIQLIKESNHVIVDHAAQGETIFKQAYLKILAGDNIINRTVAEINYIKETVDVASEKIKLLENSSQEIAQAINLITRFAAQTHLLALKASIEAARAGEQGRGFAVIADEVRTLATQSAGASAEIENLVNKIRQETHTVTQVMEKSTERVKTGADLVQQILQSLNQVTNATSEIQQLIEKIASTCDQQMVTSESVIGSIDEAVLTSTKSSQSATQLSASLSQLSQLSEQLQQNISKFKT